MNPEEVDWTLLSPQGAAILAWIAVPIAHGLSQVELAERFNLQRPRIPNLPLPAVVTSDWIAKQMRLLRAELRDEEHDRNRSRGRQADQRAS